MDAAVKVRRAPDEPLAAYLARLGDIERQVTSGKIKLQPKLTADEICPLLLFEFNQWTLTPESANIINKKLASWLKMHPQIAKAGLLAEGWADSVGTDEACRQISLKRAQTIADYVFSSLGVKIAAKGMGKSFSPPNNTEENKQKNRRVVIKRASGI